MKYLGIRFEIQYFKDQILLSPQFVSHQNCHQFGSDNLSLNEFIYNDNEVIYAY